MHLEPDVIGTLAQRASETLRAGSESPLLLLCEHAGAEVPAPWNGLGLAPALLETHYAYDPGAASLTRHLSVALDAPAVLSRYSRIFLDYNRFADDWDQMRPDLGGIPVPGNLSIGEADRALRRAVAAEPVGKAINAQLSGRRAVVSVHSFTPVMGGERREVDVGLLWDEENRFVEIAREELQARAPGFGLRPGDNEPYDLRRVKARSLKIHAQDYGLPYMYIEVNNGLFSNMENRQRLFELVAETMRALFDRSGEWHGVAT